MAFFIISAVILKQIKKESMRLIVAIGLVAVIGIGFFAPSIKSISLGFLTNLNPLQHVNLTWFGIILLILNLLSIIGAIVVTVYSSISSISKEKKS